MDDFLINLLRDARVGDEIELKDCFVQVVLSDNCDGCCFRGQGDCSLVPCLRPSVVFKWVRGKL